MELKDFIKETLSQIASGVKEAQDLVKENGALINPDRMSPSSKGGKFINDLGARYVQDIEINVAISINEKEGSKAGIGVVTGLFSAGGSTTADQENSTVSTIKFVIPMALPTSSTYK